MKKVILSFATFVLMFFTSCEKDIVESKKTASENEANRTANSVNSDVYALNLENGLPNNCANNMLVFASWESYHATIEQLDQMVETSIDDFDASIDAPNLNDEQYEQACETLGCDEDNVLINFENELGFCSLRRKLAIEESNWLDQQGDGDWDSNIDPDNHFIDDETERSLLNEQVQVAIMHPKRGIIIYQFNDDKGNFLEIHNMDLDALQQINAGVNPANIANVVNVIVKPIEPAGGCKDKVKEVKYEIVGDERFKRISKLRREVTGGSQDVIIENSKIKAKTKGYKKNRRGKWRNSRTYITVGINGPIQTNSGVAYISCLESILNIHIIKERRRYRVKVKETIPPYDGILPNLRYWTIRDNQLYSYHKRGAVEAHVDFYDMPNN